MFRIDFNFTQHTFSHNRTKGQRVSDAVFHRKLDKSDTLRHMCGFDSELYQAISGLQR